MSNFRYFKDSEIVGLITPLPAMLDLARGIAGIPFIITSGLRTKAENDALPGAVQNSAHLTGEAVDLAYTTSTQRLLILKGLYAAGFNRIGLGVNYIHCDISTSLPQNVFFLENGLAH